MATSNSLWLNHGAFAATFTWPSANTEYERRNITITGPSTNAKAQVVHTKNGTASHAETSANDHLAAERLIE
jgi:hypothetical protein